MSEETKKPGCADCGGDPCMSRYTVATGWLWYCRRHQPKAGRAYDAKFAELAKTWTPSPGKR